MKGVGPGTVLGGRYTVHRRVAEDRGTERWTADDTTLGRQVALTVVALDDHRSAAFLDAARRAASVSHAVLVRILDVGEDHGVAYVVEEVLDDAKTLARLVTDGGIPGDEVRRITGEVASALESARQRGMHHLDLTPDDVLRTTDGEIRLRGLEIAGVRAGEDGLDPDEAARRDAVGVVALTYAGLTGLWPLGAGAAGLGSAPRVPAGVASPSEIAAGVPRDLDAICRLTLNDDQGPTSPGDYARQVAPWSSRQVVGKPVVPAILAEQESRSTPAPDTEVREPSAPTSSGRETPDPSAPGADATVAGATVAGAAVVGATAAGAAAAGAAAAGAAVAGATVAGGPTSPATAPTPSPLPPTTDASDEDLDATAALPRLSGEDEPPARPDPPAWLTAGDDPFGPDADTGSDGSPADDATVPAAAVPGQADADVHDESAGPGAGAAAGIAAASAGAGAAAGRMVSRASAWFTARTRPDDDTGSRDDEAGDEAADPSAGTDWSEPDWSPQWEDERDDAAEPVRARALAGPRDEHPEHGAAAGGAGGADGAGVAGVVGVVGTRVTDLARRAVDKVSELSPDTRPAEDFDDDEPAALVPAEPLSRDESKLALGIVVAFLVLALVIGIQGVRQIGSRTDLGLDGSLSGSARPTPSASAPASPSASAGPGASPAPEPLAILKVEALDPGGDGAENNNLTPKTYDGDTSTGWNSENYATDQFGGLKDGLGLVVDLGPQVAPKQIRLDFPKPVDFQVWVGPDASLEGAKKIGEKKNVDGQQNFAVPAGVTGQYIVIWYTGLHVDGDGKRRAWLDEVVVTGTG